MLQSQSVVLDAYLFTFCAVSIPGLRYPRLALSTGGAREPPVDNACLASLGMSFHCLHAKLSFHRLFAFTK